MADKRITDLNLHTSPELSDVLPIVNDNETKRVSYGTLKYKIQDDVVISGSLNDSTLTFTKGDSSTFDIELGGTFVEPAYISCYSTSSQQLTTSGSEQPVTFSSLWTNSGINLVSGSQLVMESAGVYKFNFAVQVTNPDNETHSSYFWIKYNGNNFPHSTTEMTLLPRKSSGESSAQLMVTSIVGVAQNDGDYIELYWTGDSNTIQLEETPTNGVVPETPSIIANIVRIG